MRGLLVTSDKEQCGIREHGRLLLSHLPKDFVLEEFPHPHPDSLFAFLDCPREADLVVLNHHAALHAAWTPDHVAKLQALGYAVVVIQHDTFESLDIMKGRGFQDFRAADGLLVHELVAGMIGLAHPNCYYIQQPVPDPAPPVRLVGTRMVLGLFGFPFPWKGFPDAISAARAAGWNTRIVSATITVEQAEELQTLAGGSAEIITGWRPMEEVVGLLAACDATAFLYSCGNSGTSGAIRTGLAARRPLLAYRGCRQFRDLEYTWPSDGGISWCAGEGDATRELERLAAGPAAYREFRKAGVEATADLLSWKDQAGRMARVFEEAVARAAARRRA